MEAFHICQPPPAICAWKAGSFLKALHRVSLFLRDSRVVRPQGLPNESYEQAKLLAPLFNTLVDRVSRDGPWLKQVLADVLVSIVPSVFGDREDVEGCRLFHDEPLHLSLLLCVRTVSASYIVGCSLVRAWLSRHHKMESKRHRLRSGRFSGLFLVSPAPGS